MDFAVNGLYAIRAMRAHHNQNVVRTQFRCDVAREGNRKIYNARQISLLVRSCYRLQSPSRVRGSTPQESSEIRPYQYSILPFEKGKEKKEDYELLPIRYPLFYRRIYHTHTHTHTHTKLEYLCVEFIYS